MQRDCDCSPGEGGRRGEEGGGGRKKIIFVVFITTGQCSASEMYVAQLDDVLAHTIPKKGVAAFIAEPIQV